MVNWLYMVGIPGLILHHRGDIAHSVKDSNVVLLMLSNI